MVIIMNFKIYFIIILLGFVLGGCTSMPPKANTDNNLLLIGVDENTTLGRHTTPYKRSINAMSEVLQSQGFKVFDETNITLDDVTLYKKRLNKAKILRLTRSSTRAPLDVVILLEINYYTKKRGYGDKINASMTASAIDIDSGKFIAQAQGNASYNTADNCNIVCVKKVLTKNIKSLAIEVGSILASKINI